MSGAKAGTMHAPALNTTRGVGKPPKPPLLPDPWTHPYLTPYKEPACCSAPTLHPGGVTKRACYLISLPSPPLPHAPLPLTAAGAPINPCLKFLSGIQSISIDWGRPGTPVSSMSILHLKSIKKEEEKTEEIHSSREAGQHVFNTRTKIKKTNCFCSSRE